PEVPRWSPVASATLPDCHDVRRSRVARPMSVGERPSMALFAMDAAFSAGVLAHLVASGRVRVSVLVLAADRSRGFPEVRVAGRRGVRELASDAGLPVLVHDGDT